jgi:hypothetical protein
MPHAGVQSGATGPVVLTTPVEEMGGGLVVCFMWQQQVL